MKTHYYSLAAFMALSFLTSCGGGGSSGNELQTTTQIGQVIDSHVGGLSFVCRDSMGNIDTNGTTNESGEFEYKIGDTCQFLVGSVAIGSVAMNKEKAIITPLELSASTTLEEDGAVNLAIFLQSLDEDGNSSNGINLAHATPKFTQPQTMDWHKLTPQEINAFITHAIPNAVLVDAAQAKEHLQSTLIGFNLMQPPHTPADTPSNESNASHTPDTNGTNMPTVDDPHGIAIGEPHPDDNNGSYVDGNQGSVEPSNPTPAPLSCDTTHFQAGANVRVPTSMELLPFAGTYTVKEGSYDDSFNFLQTNTSMLSLGVDGSVIYDKTYQPESICFDNMQQIVVHFNNGSHIDFLPNKALTGISPKDSMTILKADGEAPIVVEDNGVEASNHSVLIPTGNIVDTQNITYLPLNAGKLIHFVNGNAKIEVYDYGTTLAVTANDTGMSLGVKADFNACTLTQEWVSIGYTLCSDLGISFDRTKGLIEFKHTPMKPIVLTCPTDSCEIDGSLAFTPY